MDVPTTPKAIDPAWLTALLAPTPAFKDSRITSVQATTIGVGYGLDGALARLQLTTSGGRAPRSIVAKCAGAEAGGSEIAFYERIGPRMPIRLAVFHAGLVDAVANRAVLLLEDLTHAVQGDAVEGASHAQAEAVLEAMAQFHAAFQDAGTDVMPLPAWEGRADGHVERIAERGPRFRERYGSHLSARVRSVIDDLPALLPKAAGTLLEAPRTLIHTDLHLDNVLFPATGSPVILDWPHAHRGPAILDVTRLLLEGMTVEQRRRHGETLIEGYADARTAAGRPWASAHRRHEELCAAVIWHLARTVAWAGAEDPGFDVPRVKEIVDSLVQCAAAAVHDLLA